MERRRLAADRKGGATHVTGPQRNPLPRSTCACGTVSLSGLKGEWWLHFASAEASSGEQDFLQTLGVSHTGGSLLPTAWRGVVPRPTPVLAVNRALPFGPQRTLPYALIAAVDRWERDGGGTCCQDAGPIRDFKQSAAVDHRAGERTVGVPPSHLHSSRIHRCSAPSGGGLGGARGTRRVLASLTTRAAGLVWLQPLSVMTNPPSPCICHELPPPCSQSCPTAGETGGTKEAHHPASK